MDPISINSFRIQDEIPLLIFFLYFFLSQSYPTKKIIPRANWVSWTRCPKKKLNGYLARYSSSKSKKQKKLTPFTSLSRCTMIRKGIISEETIFLQKVSMVHDEATGEMVIVVSMKVETNSISTLTPRWFSTKVS